MQNFKKKCDLTVLLNKGLHSQIWLIQEKHYSQKRVAKLFLVDDIHSSYQIDKFSRLSHPSIVSFKGKLSEDKQKGVCVIMQLCSRRDLRKFQNKDQNLLCKLIKDLVAGLYYLQVMKISYRLQPTNVLVTQNFDFKLTDFGQIAFKEFIPTQCNVKNLYLVIKWIAQKNRFQLQSFSNPLLKSFIKEIENCTSISELYDKICQPKPEYWNTADIYNKILQMIISTIQYFQQIYINNSRQINNQMIPFLDFNLKFQFLNILQSQQCERQTKQRFKNYEIKFIIDFSNYFNLIKDEKNQFGKKFIQFSNGLSIKHYFLQGSFNQVMKLICTPKNQFNRQLFLRLYLIKNFFIVRRAGVLKLIMNELQSQQYMRFNLLDKIKMNKILKLVESIKKKFG